MTMAINDKNNNINHNSCNEAARSLYRGLALAPMVRASTTPLRILALQYGADFTYTEELIDRSISQTIRVENKHLNTIDYIKDPLKLSKKTRRKLQSDNNRPCLILRIDPKLEKNKLVCQLGSGEKELALEAATHVIKDVSAIDINMGCPRKFSVSGGMGSALLEDPDRAARILRTLKNDLLSPLHKPLSCKIRLLENTQKTLDFIEAMIHAGADAVAIHGRRPGHDQTKAADWNSLEEVLGLLRPKYPDFNFLINGDFYDRVERSEFVNRTKVDGVLLGRPALYNTSIFLPTQQQPLVDKTTVVQEYLHKSVKYDTHYKNAKYVICEMMSHRRMPTGRVPYLPISFPGGQTIAKTCNCQDFQSMCQVWNVNYSNAINDNINNKDGNDYTKSTRIEAITNKIGTTSSATPADREKTDATAHTCTTTSLTAGEHKYEDSYFLKKREAKEVQVDEGKKSDDKLQQYRDEELDEEIVNNDCQKSLKRAKIL